MNTAALIEGSPKKENCCVKPGGIYATLVVLLTAACGTFAAVIVYMYNNLEGQIKILALNHTSNGISKSTDENQNSYIRNVTDSNLTIQVLNLQSDIQELQSEMKAVQDITEKMKSESTLIAIQFAGTFAILGALISIWHIMTHFRKYNQPFIQRKVVAILWLVPIFSVTSWLSLVFPKAHPYLTTFKEFYEAYAIYTFISFLIAVLGKGDRNRVISLLQLNADHFKPPISFISFFCPCINHSKKRVKYYDHHPRAKAEAVLDQCQFFAMQFVFIRPLSSIVTVLCDLSKLGDGHNWDYRYPQFYMNMLANLSIGTAFTGLMRFYHALRHELAWINPFSKFMCIKGIVFMTFWQGVLLSFVSSAIAEAMDYGQVKESSHESRANIIKWGRFAQNFLVCLEMFFFSMAHVFVFPTEEWQDGYKEAFRRRKQVDYGDKMAWKDFINDVQVLIKNRKAYAQKKRKRKLEGQDSDSGDLDIEWKDGWGRIQKFIIEEVDGIDVLKEVNGNDDESVYSDVHPKPNLSSADSDSDLTLTEEKNERPSIV